MTTLLSRISDTAPAPRVVYQRTLFDMWGQREPPVTTTPVPPVAEPTPLDDCRPLEEDDEEVEVDGDDDVVLEVVAVLAAVVAVEEPGMVAALTALKRPTPATAPIAAPVVRRLRVRIAASLASILASWFLFMWWKLAALR